MMKVLLALGVFILAAALVVSATMGAGTLVPGGSDNKQTPSSGVGSPGKPRILPAGLTPPKIKGTGFKPGENVTVKVLEGMTKGTKRVRADASGSFSVTLPGLGETCAGMTVTAVGDKGSRTSFQLSSFACALPGVGS
jgi:hypothetical protein